MKLIKDITSFIFVEDQPVKGDVIFIPGGSWPEPSETAAKLWQEGYAPYILPSGRYSVKKGFFPGPKAKTNVYKGIYKTEWEFMSDVLRHHGVKQEAILREDKSENTFQNAFYARKITDNANIIINKGIICCKAFHARRCLMYYSWAYPGVEFVVCPTETQNINKNNWFESPEGIERVMGELARCGMQLKEAIDTYKNEGRY